MFGAKIVIISHIPNGIWRIEINGRKIKRFHNALFNSAPRLRMSANSFWACSSNSFLRSMARLKPAMSSSLVFSLNLIIVDSPFHFANIILYFENCKTIKEKAPNDGSLGAFHKVNTDLQSSKLFVESHLVCFIVRVDVQYIQLRCLYLYFCHVCWRFIWLF